jgi:hypothetical protein
VILDFDTNTLEGRQAFDRAVAQKLLDTALSRSDVAKRLEIDEHNANALRAVATSLKRGLRDGWAVVHGTGAWAKYAKMKKSVKVKKP